MRKGIFVVIVGVAVSVVGFHGLRAFESSSVQNQRPTAEIEGHRELVDRYCVTCHNEDIVSGNDETSSPLVAQLRLVGLTLDTLDLTDVAGHPAVWEKVVRKLRGGVMPPAGRPRPEAASLEHFTKWLEDELDRTWARSKDPGRTATFHRLNRTEYRNAIRDLLAVEINEDDFLPADDSSFGFDNIGGVLKMSQSLICLLYTSPSPRD